MEFRHEIILLALRSDQPQNINSISETTGLDRNWISKALKELILLNLIKNITSKDNRNKQFIFHTVILLTFMLASCSGQPNPIKKGDRVPSFSATDITGKTVSLADVANVLDTFEEQLPG